VPHYPSVSFTSYPSCHQLVASRVTARASSTAYPSPSFRNSKGPFRGHQPTETITTQTTNTTTTVTIYNLFKASYRREPIDKRTYEETERGAVRDSVVTVVKRLDEVARSLGTSRHISFEERAIQVLRQTYRRTDIQRRRAYSRHLRLATALVTNRSILYGSRATALIGRPLIRALDYTIRMCLA
jgi:hypothetical protein